MKHRRPRRISAPIRVLPLALLIPSCSMPPSEAWRNFTAKVSSVFSSSRSSHLKNDAHQSQLAASRYQRIGTTQIASSAPSGVIIPGRPGFVRTPFTTPGRLVDVRDFSPGNEVRCPYTQRVFIVPSSSNSPLITSDTQLASNRRDLGERITNPRKSPTVTWTNRDTGYRKQIYPSTSTPRKRPEPATTNPAPRSTPNKVVVRKDPPTLPKIDPPSTPSSPPDKPAAPTTSAGTPYGVAVGGRPGFVNSPFAAKHQLVDVTGLPAGTEVKCPYSGKLFRVPGATTTGSGPATVEKENKSGSDSPPKEKPDVSAGLPSLTGDTIIAELDPAKLSKTKTAADTPIKSKPTAMWAPGKDGYVVSPHAAGKFVDVRDKAPGSQTRCPFTGKVFVVPE